MEKRNVFDIFMIITILTLLNTALISCSNDDNEKDESSVNALIGTWEETDYTDGIWQWTFNSKGDGLCLVTSALTNYAFNFTYTFNGSTLLISGAEDGKKYTDTYVVTFSSDKKTMTWVETDNGNTYTRVLKKK